MKFSIVIPTFRRPKSLICTLESIRLQTIFDSSNFLIYVVDNNQPDADGADAARKWAISHGLIDRVICVHAVDRGLSYCRNAGLSAAFSGSLIDAVVMIDDDACGEPNWLKEILNGYFMYGGDILGGPTIYTFDDSVPSDIRANTVFGVPYCVSGPVPQLRSSNNAVIRRVVYERYAPFPFDIRFNASGGEDTNFFSRARRDGFLSVWLDNSRVIEPVPSSRATTEWVLQRHYMSAVNRARSEIITFGRFVGTARQLFFAIKEFVGGGCRMFLFSSAGRHTGRLRLIGARGRLAGLINMTVSHK